MNFLWSSLPTIAVLGILILVHEWGHFIACRLSGVRVEKFSIGFGPELFHFQGKKTRYVISLFLLGGYVKPAGESASDIGPEGFRPGDYLAAPVWKRIFIVVSGVFMNYLLGFVLFTGIFLAGRPLPLAQVGGFAEGYPAETSGLEKGDRIVSVEGQPVTTWEQLTGELSRIRQGEVTLEIVRRSRLESYRVPVRVEQVKDVFGETHFLARLGIRPDPEANEIVKLAPGPALREAFLTEVHLTTMTYKAIYYLVTGQLSLKTISGPVGIIAMTGTAVKLGFVYLLHLTAVLSISLAVINLLPIPALDGGHFLFLLIEVIQRRRVSFEFQERAAQVGFVLLMALMVFVLYNDLVNLEVVDRLKMALGR